MARTISRREFLKIAGAGAVALSVPWEPLWGAEKTPKRRPNILIILADDLGYGELGCQGGKDIPTPNIDSIARNGIRFTNGYVSCPVCSPTRAGLMTGRYQQRFGHEFNPGSPQGPENFGLPRSETTLAARLKSAGYATGLVGKWHLGAREGYRPLDRGFEEFFGFLGGGHSYVRSAQNSGNPIMRGNEPVDEKAYLTDALSREAVDFVKRHREEPFFLYLSFNAVHSPLQATDKYLSRFAEIKDEKRRTFAAMLSAMDDAVGDVLATLRTNGLEEQTLIFFLSDNGGPTAQTTSGNGPLRGFKGQVYEGGIRVPFMCQWKGRLPAGKVYDKPVTALDLSPTSLAAAGAKADSARSDGVDLLPYLAGKKKTEPHRALYWRFGKQCAIREGDWKLLKGPTSGGWELYDLAADIGEKEDLAAKQPEKAKKLEAGLMKWDAELAEPLWGGRARRQGKRPRRRLDA